ncbi:MAG TPA: metallophosphoesterase [Alphaproteobacteria bacterium]|nr:hypothetical protein [Rhodospirillaceae bacterium]HRJ12597.1 metallophosphoesterase [Alphaproteobacteria bacterium]
MRIAFITDLHFGRLTIGAEAALLADLRAQKPDLILIGGDITQRGLSSQFRDCQKFLAALPAEWVCIIGNHDVPAWNLIQRFCDPYGPYQKFVTQDLNPQWSNEYLAVQGLNSARRMMRDWAWEQGAIDDQQIGTTKSFFAQHPDKTKILMVHHPITHPPLAPTRLLAENYQRALTEFAEAGADIICTGHLHLASVWDGKELVSGRQKPLWLLQGGTAMCDRLRGECNSYWIIEVTSGNLNFILRNLGADKFD